MTPRQQRHLHRAIEQALLGELSQRQHTRLLAQLRTDPSARATYDRTVAAFRVLEQSDVASIELEHVATRLFAANAWQPANAAPKRGWWLLASSLVAVAAVLLVVVSTRPPPGPGPSEYIAARAGHGPASGLAIQALCGPADAQSPLVPTTSGPCPWSGRLSFAYTISSTVAPGSLLTLFAVDDHGRVNFYAPTPDGITSIVTEAGRWQALPISIALAVNHTPGRWRLYAVTTPTPLTPAAVTEAAAALQPVDATATPWTQRLRGRTQVSDLCASATTSHTAELEFWIEEDTP